MKTRLSKTQKVSLIAFLILGFPFLFGILVNLVNVRPVFLLPGEVERAFRFQQGLSIYFESDEELWTKRSFSVEWYPDSIAASKQSNPELGGIPTMIKPISFVPYFHEKQMHPEVGRLSTQGFSNFLALLLIGFPFALIVAVDQIRRSNKNRSEQGADAKPDNAVS